MKCRIDIIGRKVWNDNNDAYKKRPPSVEIALLRNGAPFKTATLNEAGNWMHNFACLPVRKNSEEKYEYSVDEPLPTAGYKKTTDGYSITNTLENITITGKKIWADSHNKDGLRPNSVTINLLQNNVQFSSVNLAKPLDTEDTSEFKFENVPFADAQLKPYVYTVEEKTVANYTTTIEGFNITNSHTTP